MVDVGSGHLGLQGGPLVAWGPKPPMLGPKAEMGPEQGMATPPWPVVMGLAPSPMPVGLVVLSW